MGKDGEFSPEWRKPRLTKAEKVAKWRERAENRRLVEGKLKVENPKNGKKGAKRGGGSARQGEGAGVVSGNEGREVVGGQDVEAQKPVLNEISGRAEAVLPTE